MHLFSVFSRNLMKICIKIAKTSFISMKFSLWRSIFHRPFLGGPTVEVDHVRLNRDVLFLGNIPRPLLHLVNAHISQPFHQRTKLICRSWARKWLRSSVSSRGLTSELVAMAASPRLISTTMTLPPAPDLPSALLTYQRRNILCDAVLLFSPRIDGGDRDSESPRIPASTANRRRRPIRAGDWREGKAAPSKALLPGRAFKDKEAPTHCISAHKVVLAAASPYFRKAIGEASENVVITISEPVEESDMKRIVAWIYGGLKEVEVSTYWTWATYYCPEVRHCGSRDNLLENPF